ncbi:pro-sigmaK processing inhibitor BofA family protein [Sporotomaculum syntrophicum]|uniref:pro-sigmaK processing inhibitor BofA family protein n=1 Tax=Sporotomaculum syntrophicum TaxID=182264 RepID=UPI00137A1848|nr:pro-sigmaK processing inhibitor BofA family protein [Sporotomaculum syntrophicum]
MEWFLLVIGLLILGLYVNATIISKTLRWLFSLVGYLFIGTVLLVLLNWGLGYLEMHVAYNPFTVLVAGILRLPGLVVLVFMSQWFA